MQTEHLDIVSDSGAGRSGQADAFKRQFQRLAYRRLLMSNAPCPVSRVRSKLERFRLTEPAHHPTLHLTIRQLTPEWMGRRSLANLFLLKALVPPRVISAAFSTIWNRWVTHRRFQKRDEAGNRCVLGCSASAEDSIEHYCRCPRTTELASRVLRLPGALHSNLYTFTLCNPHAKTIEDLTMQALLVYAVYSATNRFRNTGLPHPTIAYDALAQFAREGARGHSQASRTLDSRWRRDALATPLPPIPVVLPPRARHANGQSMGPAFPRP